MLKEIEDLERLVEESDYQLDMQNKFLQSIEFIKAKGVKISLARPLFDNNTRSLVKSIYNELDKGLSGTGVEQLFLRSIYKMIYTLANTKEAPMEGSVMDNPQVEMNRAISGIMKYGKALNLLDLDLGISTKKSLKRVLLDFKKIKNSGTVFKLLDKIRLVIEILVESSQDDLYESKLDSLCEAWSVK